MLSLAVCALLASPPPALPLEDVLARHHRARGGYERLKAVRTVVHSRGQYREGDFVGAGRAFMALKRPYYRVVGEPGRSTFLEGYDGSTWEYYADPGVVIRTVGAAAAATRRGADIEGPLVDAEAKGHRVAPGPAAEIGGRPAYQVVLTYRDGFVRRLFLDAQSFLLAADRWAAPVHAYGAEVETETRYADYREVGGVMFAFRVEERKVATGELLNSMQWGAIEVDRELPDAWFLPPEFVRTPLQRLLEQLFLARTDTAAVTWILADFRRAHPAVETREGIEFIAYHFLKMGDVPAAVALLVENAARHPEVASAAFGLGRAYQAAGDRTRARAEYQRALRLDPSHARAAKAIREMER